MVLKVYRFQKRAFLLRLCMIHVANWRQRRRSCHSGKTKTDKMMFCLVPKILF